MAAAELRHAFTVGVFRQANTAKGIVALDPTAAEFAPAASLLVGAVLVLRESFELFFGRPLIARLSVICHLPGSDRSENGEDAWHAAA